MEKSSKYNPKEILHRSMNFPLSWKGGSGAYLVNEKIFVSTKFLPIPLSALSITSLYHIPMHTPQRVWEKEKKCNLCNRNFPSPATTWLSSSIHTMKVVDIAIVILGLGWGKDIIWWQDIIIEIVLLFSCCFLWLAIFIELKLFSPSNLLNQEILRNFTFSSLPIHIHVSWMQLINS